LFIIEQTNEASSLGVEWKKGKSEADYEFTLGFDSMAADPIDCRRLIPLPLIPQT